ncbi:MAG: hypothetical protein L6Q37_07790, partial [Bdellovibrionaceae bacterium]|nr:hypothetical protein [Pseudobdellovibrionaceae bacterium]
RGVIANFYLHSDMKLSRSRLNSWIFAMNGIPFLNGPLPQKSDSKNKIDRLVQANRDIYKRLLNRCLAIYSDLRLSDLEIQEGPCGIRPRYTEVH